MNTIILYILAAVIIAPAALVAIVVYAIKFQRKRAARRQPAITDDPADHAH
jgi:hypothetical protein